MKEFKDRPWIHLAMPGIALLINLLMLVIIKPTDDMQGVTLLAFLISAGILKFYAMSKLLEHYSGIGIALAIWVVISALLGTVIARIIFAILSAFLKF